MDDNEEAGSEKSAETAVSHEEDVEQAKLIMYKHFVLPKRSTRSSRIIKPNKRLLEMGGISSCITSNSNSSSSKNTSSTKKSNEISTKASAKPKNYFGLGDLADETAASSSSPTTSSSTALSLSLGKEHFPSSITTKQYGSFVLRKSRLQLQTDNSGSSTFAAATNKSTLLSATSSSAMSAAANAVTFGSSSLSSPGKCLRVSNRNLTKSFPVSLLVSPMACAVCATPVNNKEAPLARKYGVIACEVCRKFISRVTKISKLSTAQSSSQQQLQCKGSTDGKCGNCDSLCVTSFPNSLFLLPPRWQLQHTLA